MERSGDMAQVGRIEVGRAVENRERERERERRRRRGQAELEKV